MRRMALSSPRLIHAHLIPGILIYLLIKVAKDCVWKGGRGAFVRVKDCQRLPRTKTPLGNGSFRAGPFGGGVGGVVRAPFIRHLEVNRETKAAVLLTSDGEASQQALLLPALVPARIFLSFIVGGMAVGAGGGGFAVLWAKGRKRIKLSSNCHLLPASLPVFSPCLMSRNRAMLSGFL